MVTVTKVLKQIDLFDMVECYVEYQIDEDKENDICEEYFICLSTQLVIAKAKDWDCSNKYFKTNGVCEGLKLKKLLIIFVLTLLKLLLKY